MWPQRSFLANLRADTNLLTGPRISAGGEPRQVFALHCFPLHPSTVGAFCAGDRSGELGRSRIAVADDGARQASAPTRPLRGWVRSRALPRATAPTSPRWSRSRRTSERHVARRAHVRLSAQRSCGRSAHTTCRSTVMPSRRATARERSFSGTISEKSRRRPRSAACVSTPRAASVA